MGLLHLVFGSRAPGTETVRPIHLAAGNGFNFDIVGEASYQAALNDLCGGKCDEGYDLRVVAQLCFQEDNPYDRDAVAVFIERRVVGYVPRTEAQRFRSEILRINPQQLPVTCDAKIVGGWYRGCRDEGHFGVKLSLAEPLRRREP